MAANPGELEPTFGDKKKVATKQPERRRGTKRTNRIGEGRGGRDNQKGKAKVEGEVERVGGERGEWR